MKERIINFFNSYKSSSILLAVYIRLKSKFIIKKKSKIFLNKLSYISNKNLWLVYDYNTSPISYGDIMHLIILSRYFSLKFNKIIIYYIVGEIRKDYIKDGSEFIDENKFNIFFKEILKLTNKLKKNNCEIKIGTWKDFKISINLKNFFLQNYIFEENKICNRIQIYKDFFLYINFLLLFDKKNIDKTILNSKNINIGQNKFEKFINQSYISFHCRYSNQDLSRNLSEKEFLKIISFLKNKYQNFPIFIISDSHGCKFFKKIANNHNLPLLFSKDYTSNFLEDGFLVLNSKFYFQFKGGGIHTFVEFSKTKFFIQKYPSNEIWHSYKKSLFFHNNNQISTSGKNLKSIFKNLEYND